MPTEAVEQLPSELPQHGGDLGGAGLQAPDCLLPHHREHLRASGLSDDTIKASGAFSVTDGAEARRLLHSSDSANIPTPALAFPYPGCPDYVRLRPDLPRIPNPDYSEPRDHELRLGEQAPEFLPGAKYLSPGQVPTRLYVPKAVKSRLVDCKTKLWLTEGEKKVLAGWQAGLAIVGAPGVTCFGDSAARKVAGGIGREERRLHPDLVALDLKGREVVIIFDSDIDTNDKVLAAAAKLGQMLDYAGALACIAYLSKGIQGEKVGLDDFFLANSAADGNRPHALTLLEESVRPLNVEECVTKFLAPAWEDWPKRDQDAELGRAVRLACHVFKRKTDLNGWCKRTSRTLDVPEDRVRSFVVEVDRTADHDPRVWVARWLNDHEVSYICRDDMFTLDGKPVVSDSIFREMTLDAVTWGGPSRQSIEDALCRWRDGQRGIAVERLRQGHEYRDGLGENSLATFVSAVTGKTDQVDVAVLKHFVWQVKRRIAGLRVEHHLMPILVGRQGSGKSRAIGALLSPIENFVDAPGDLAVIADERHAFRLHESYVLVFDEMAKAKKVDIDSLKNRITQDTVRWRVLGSNRKAAGPNNATFIGAANESVVDLIYDPTGVRRFYEVRCQDRMNWDAINSLDYGALWASVNERAEPPVGPVLTELRSRQENMRVKDAVEEFLSARCEVGGEDWTAAKDVFDSFKAFLDYDRRGREPWTSARFGRRLKELLGRDQWKQSNGVKYRLRVRDPDTAAFVLPESARAVVRPVAQA